MHAEKEINSDISMAGGAAGLAVAYRQVELLFPGEGWQHAAIDQMKSCLEGATKQQLNYGILAGLTGLAFAWRFVFGEVPESRRTQDTLDRLSAVSIVDRIEKDSSSGGSLDSSRYDIVEGAAGVLIHLLKCPRTPHVAKAVHTTLEYLVTMAGNGTAGPAAIITLSDDADSRVAADAELSPARWDMGLAHGIPGILVALSKAAIAGVEHPGLGQAIEDVAKWLISQRINKNGREIWPYHTSVNSDDFRSVRCARMAWCYGYPGVSRALWMAGVANHDETLKNEGVNWLLEACQHPFDSWGTDSASFCHGTSGVLHILLRFCSDTGHEVFAKRALETLEYITSQYVARDIGSLVSEPQGGSDERPTGLLEGFAGILLVLLSARHSIEPNWDEAFGLS